VLPGALWQQFLFMRRKHFATPLLPTPADGIKFYLAQTAHPFNRGRVFSTVAMANIVNFDEGLGPLTAAHAVVCI